jgi:predicted RNA binding protein YcfA (HicA-like mRNA interferase family)
MKVKRIIEILIENGYVFDRFGKGDHKIYKHQSTGNIAVVDGKPSTDLPVGTLAGLRRTTGIQELK